MKQFITNYLTRQQQVLAELPTQQIADLIELFRNACEDDRQIFAFGNGGSATNASHFITDLSKGASDKWPKRFRGMSLNENVSWITALGNDYAYEDVYVRQLMNFAQPGDLVMVLSVSGNSPNLVKALTWCRANKIHSVALVGGQRGQLAQLADTVIVIDDTHYGRVEEAHMSICHLICYAFIEANQKQG